MEAMSRCSSCCLSGAGSTSGKASALWTAPAAMGLHGGPGTTPELLQASWTRKDIGCFSMVPAYSVTVTGESSTC